VSHALIAACIAALEYLLKISKDDVERARLTEQISELRSLPAWTAP
jgi:hypothetical protein